MSNVLVDKNKIDLLANAISNKSGESLTLTLDEMVEAVDGIKIGGGGGITPTGNIDITQAGVTDVTNYATATVPTANAVASGQGDFFTQNNIRKWKLTDRAYAEEAGWVNEGVISEEDSIYNAVPANTTITPTTSAQTIGGADYMMEGAVTVAAMPTGTAGTPTATKGAVSNHSVSITPSVINTTGYIAGGTKTGNAVAVSASELVSGSETKTANGTYDVTNLASLVVNVSGGSSMNVQVAQSTSRSTSTSYTELISLTCSVSGTYDVYWTTFRSSTSGTWGSQLYLDNTAYGSAQTGSWSNHIQNIHLTNVRIEAGEEVAVRVRSRGSNYYGYVGNLIIKQTS